MSIERARLLIKRGNGKPTIPTSNDHTDGTWLTTDIYVGEQYLDLDTGVIYTRDANDDINQVSNGGLIGVYKAIISQNGANPPSEVRVAINTIGDVTYSKVFNGLYRGQFDTDIDLGDSIVHITDGSSPIATIVQAYISDTDTVTIQSRDITGTRADDRLNLASISIEVYAPQTIS
jgi:hypothetical protein